jgi:hypothetical protein
VDTLRIIALGDWKPGQVLCRWTESSFNPNPATVKLIDAAWKRASRRRGKMRLYDGPMCRLESFRATPRRLLVNISRTSYKQFLGTNLTNPSLVIRHGPAALANPIGVSCALMASDGSLLMGHRNDRVAFYPRYIHPFAGALEPARNVDVFEELLRELREELHLNRRSIVEMSCVGMVQDLSLGQPEIICLARANKTADQLKSRLDLKEHADTFELCCNPTAARDAFRYDNLTPVARATILLWGRHVFGEKWFEFVGSARGRAAKPRS